MSEAALPISAALPPSDRSNVRVVRLRPAAPRPARNGWLLFPAVFLATAGGTFLISYFRTGSVIASTPRANPVLDARIANLDLRVETQGLGLRLSWNRFNPLVGMASSGMLEIDDGQEHRTIALDRSQIVNGSVVYRPSSDDVSFRLNLHAGQGPDVAQVLRVLDASPHHPLLIAVPDKPLSVVPDKRLAAAIRQKPSTPDVERSAHRDSVEVLTPREHSAAIASQPDARRALPAATPSAAQQTSAAIAQATPPLADGETALPKRGQIEPQQVPAVTPPSQQPATNVPASDVIPDSVAAKPGPVLAYVPPRPIKWVQPDQRLFGGSNVTMPVDITVKVKIDESGHVSSAHALITGGKHDKKLMAAAAAAVRQWVFEPAKAHGVNVPSEETIVVHLGPEAQ